MKFRITSRNTSITRKLGDEIIQELFKDEGYQLIASKVKTELLIAIGMSDTNYVVAGLDLYLGDNDIFELEHPKISTRACIIPMAIIDKNAVDSLSDSDNVLLNIITYFGMEEIPNNDKLANTIYNMLSTVIIPLEEKREYGIQDLYEVYDMYDDPIEIGDNSWNFMGMVYEKDSNKVDMKFRKYSGKHIALVYIFPIDDEDNVLLNCSEELANNIIIGNNNRIKRFTNIGIEKPYNPDKMWIPLTSNLAQAFRNKGLNIDSDDIIKIENGQDDLNKIRVLISLN